MTVATATKLPPDLRTLAGRLANERIRPLAWREARTIRQDVLQRLQSGEDAAALADELRRAIDAAVAGQRA